MIAAEFSKSKYRKTHEAGEVRMIVSNACSDIRATESYHELHKIEFRHVEANPAADHWSKTGFHLKQVGKIKPIEDFWCQDRIERAPSVGQQVDRDL